MKGALLVCGTHSDAGKSVVAAGICRWLRRQGVRVAPFKAQNMALNSVVTLDGGEIGRAQAMQAAAAGVEPEAAMNPVLLKPSGERRSQVVVMGRPHAEADARSYQDLKRELAPVVAGALADLRGRFDVVVCEGAGSPAETNLRRRRPRQHGPRPRRRPAGAGRRRHRPRRRLRLACSAPWRCSTPTTRPTSPASSINKFRGDDALLAPASTRLEEPTGRPVLGVLPWRDVLWLDAEDSLGLATAGASRRPPRTTRSTSPWSACAGSATSPTSTRWRPSPACACATPARPPTSSAPTSSSCPAPRPPSTTSSALRSWRTRPRRSPPARLPERRCSASAAATRCSASGSTTRSSPGAARRRASACSRSRPSSRPTSCCAGAPASLPGCRAPPAATRSATAGSRRHGGEPLLADDAGEPEGCRAGSVLGTSWHGLLEHDDLRRSLLGWVAKERGLRFRPSAKPFAEVREERLDALGDLVADHLDTGRLAELIEGGPPPGLPSVHTEVSACLPS